MCQVGAVCVLTMDMATRNEPVEYNMQSHEPRSTHGVNKATLRRPKSSIMAGESRVWAPQHISASRKEKVQLQLNRDVWSWHP